MDRLRKRLGYLSVLALLAALLAASGGCTAALTTAMYLIKGTNVGPDYSLKGKKVCVVCRAVGGDEYQKLTAARDMGRQVNRLLREQIGKIEVTDQRKVEEWEDENLWDDFEQVGKAMGVDLVIGIDLERFSMFQGQTLYQGKAAVHLKVVEVATGDTVFEKDLQQMQYPPNAMMQTSEIQESEFRSRVLQIFADQIARHFYAHDAHADLALDATSAH